MHSHVRVCVYVHARAHARTQAHTDIIAKYTNISVCPYMHLSIHLKQKHWSRTYVTACLFLMLEPSKGESPVLTEQFQTLHKTVSAQCRMNNSLDSRVL